MTATVAIAGSSGLIGSALVTALRTADHHVLRIVRRAPANANELHWDPDGGEFDTGALQGVDAVVNLCGISIGQRRWSGAFKQTLRDSRITPTEVLATAVADAGVGVLVNASAVGYYGDTKDRVVDETSSPGTGFLARLCMDWEAVTAPARYAGTRVVLARTGVVLAASGGALRQLRPLFSVGLGARLGNGRQYMSWISLEDQVRALRFAHRRQQAVRAGQPDRAGAGHQCRIHRGAGPGGQPVHPAGDAGVRSASCARRVRRRDAVEWAARDPRCAGAGRLRV